MWFYNLTGLVLATLDQHPVQKKMAVYSMLELMITLFGIPMVTPSMVVQVFTSKPEQPAQQVHGLQFNPKQDISAAAVKQAR